MITIPWLKLMLIVKLTCKTTVEPSLSGHPEGIARWPVNFFLFLLLGHSLKSNQLIKTILTEKLYSTKTNKKAFKFTN